MMSGFEVPCNFAASASGLALQHMLRCYVDVMYAAIVTDDKYSSQQCLRR